MRTKKGFTLIELMLIVAIIIILVTIALVSLNTAKVRAQSTTAMQMANSLLRGAVLARETESGIFNNNWRNLFLSANDTSECASGNNFDNDASAEAVCKKILESSGEHGNDWELSLVSLSPNTLSVMVRLPNGRTYCTGSNSRISEETSWDGSGCLGGADSWVCSGCAVDVLNN